MNIHKRAVKRKERKKEEEEEEKARKGYSHSFREKGDKSAIETAREWSILYRIYICNIAKQGPL